MRISFVSNYPLPYHTPILNELATLADLHVIYMSRRHALDRVQSRAAIYQDPWGAPPSFPHTFHWSTAMRSKQLDLRLQLSVGLSRHLARLKPDVVLFSS